MRKNIVPVVAPPSSVRWVIYYNVNVMECVSLLKKKYYWSNGMKIASAAIA